MVPLDRALVSSYSLSIVTVPISSSLATIYNTEFLPTSAFVEKATCFFAD